MKAPNYFSHLQVFKQLMDQTGVSLTWFLIPTLLSATAAAFEGFSFGLLLPLAQAVIDKNFLFLQKMPWLNQIICFFLQDSYPKNRETFTLIIILIFTFAMIKILCTYLSSLLVSKTIAEFGHRLRKLIFGHYLRSEKSFFDESNLGQLNGSLLGFTNELMTRLDSVHLIISNVFMLCAYLVLMGAMSWVLLIAMLVLSPILYLSLQWVVNKVKRASSADAMTKIELSDNIANTLLCMSLVKACAKEDAEARTFNDISDRIAQIQYSLIKKINFIAPLQETYALIASLCLIAAIGAIQSRGESSIIGGFLVFFITMRRAMASFTSLNAAQAHLAAIEGAADVIQSTIEKSKRYYFPNGILPFTGLKASIWIHGLSFSYKKERRVLENVNLEIEKGKLTALVGATGEGKTTLVNLIMRFYDCPERTIFIDETDIRDFDTKTIRRHIGYVTQDAQILNDTLKSNILYGVDRQVTEVEFHNVLKVARLDDFVEKLPLKELTIVGDRGVLLSGGEKQRVSIARALLRKAEILILDEATSSLDSVTEKLIQAAIKAAIENRTAIIIAHRLSTIRQADKICILENGKIKEEGSFEELIQRGGIFHRFWKQQNLNSAMDLT